MLNLSPENTIIGLQRQALDAEHHKFAGMATQSVASRAMAGPAIFLLGLFCLYPACADIYSYTDNDGTVYLSNAPANKHYQVLVASADEQANDAPLSQAKSTVSGFSGMLGRKLQYDQIVAEVARIYGMDSALLHAVISVESNYNPKAVSRKGASGLMQLMPAIAKHYGVVDMFDPVQNLHGGAKYLRDMLLLFNNDVSLAVAAYNAGETAVVRYGNRIPPFQETRDYVPKVLNFYREYRAERPRVANVLNVPALLRPLVPRAVALSRADKVSAPLHLNYL